ncbi:MAG TPA: hypothetical protein VIY29_29720 [Ktedonobacteraceae bacterium]
MGERFKKVRGHFRFKRGRPVALNKGDQWHRARATSGTERGRAVAPSEGEQWHRARATTRDRPYYGRLRLLECEAAVGDVF